MYVHHAHSRVADLRSCVTARPTGSASEDPAAKTSIYTHTMHIYIYIYIVLFLSLSIYIYMIMNILHMCVYIYIHTYVSCKQNNDTEKDELGSWARMTRANREA